MHDQLTATGADVDISNHLMAFCKEKGYGPEELLTAIIRISALTLGALNNTGVSGEIGKHLVEINLNVRS